MPTKGNGIASPASKEASIRKGLIQAELSQETPMMERNCCLQGWQHKMPEI